MAYVAPILGNTTYTYRLIQAAQSVREPPASAYIQTIKKKVLCREFYEGVGAGYPHSYPHVNFVIPL